MSGLEWVAVAVLGGLGACLRHAASGWVSSLVSKRAAEPQKAAGPAAAGTLAVNVTGALLLGVITGVGVDGRATLLLGGALLGSVTTFSTLMLDTVTLWRQRRAGTAFGYLAGSFVAGLLAFALGDWAGSGWRDV